MSENELYRAIGDADEAFLRECEDQLARRVPRHFGLIAAMLVLLLTACAPAAIQAFHALKEATVTQTGHETIAFDITPDTLEADHYELRLDVEIGGNIPETVENYYIPEAIEKYSRNSYWTGLYNTGYTVYFSMDNDPLQSCFYSQRVLSGYLQDGGVLLKSISSAQYPLEASTKIYREVTALEVFSGGIAATSEDGAYTYVERTLYWSDGMYLYCMGLPADMSEELVCEFLNSLVPTEDPGAYFRQGVFYSVVELDFAADADAPDTITETCLPIELLKRGRVVSWSLEEDRLSVELTMDGPGDSIYTEVRYEQRVIPGEAPFRFRETFCPTSRTGEQAVYGTVQATEFKSASQNTGSTSAYGPQRLPAAITANHHIYWSDGRYIYSVSLPPVISDSVIGQILSSLTRVEDITEYLNMEE